MKFYGAKRYTTGGVRNLKGRSCKLYLQYSDDEGRRKQVQTSYVLPDTDDSRTLSRSKAEDALATWQREMEEAYETQLAQPDPAEVAIQAMTVADCARAYLDSLTNIHRSTRASYSGLLARVIAPRIGSIPLSELSKQDVTNWAASIVEDYSRNTCNNAMRLLRAALDYARDEEQGWITRNAAARVKLPKAEGGEQDTPNALTNAEIARVAATVNSALYADPENQLEVFRKLPHMLAVKIALYTGLRRGEICALQWRDIDFEHRTVSVNRSIGIDGSEFYIKEPKSKSSRRTVECPPELMEDLKKRRAAMLEECAQAGIKLTPNHYVIGNVDGEYMKPPRIDDHWRAMVRALALVGTNPDKGMTFHCLRHTYATVMLQNRLTDLVTLSKMLGHSNPSITLNKYGSTDNEAKRLAADRLGAFVANKAAQHDVTKQILELGKTGTEE